ncbi:hypothetical protein D9M68_575600 [compost metagenome]
MTIGSSTIGPALRRASSMALRPAAWKAMSLESTEWLLPSWTVTLTSSTGKPARVPAASAERTPFSTEGMNCPGMTPPLIASTNSKPLPRGKGSRRRNTSPNCPAPPVCFLCREWPSAGRVAVSR